MIDLLRKLLDLRESLAAIAETAEGYGCAESLPEIADMRKLERQAFGKVSEWEKPDADPF